MSVFNKYSFYYDLFYKNKDYQAEVDYVIGLIKKINTNYKSILDLGSGTGAHDFKFAKAGFDVHGGDLSSEMVELAEKQFILYPDLKDKVKFSVGDARTVELNKKFDVVVSLFHVINYQTTNKDLQNFFETAVKHLNPGGLLIFDSWYGPAVLTNLPEVRCKELETETHKVLRVAQPEVYENENCVDVNYRVLITDKKTKVTDEILETHKMRYLFKPEIEKLFNDNNFELVCFEEWLTENTPGFDSWGVTFVGKKV